MRRLFGVSALGHALLLMLLYVERAARPFIDEAPVERTARRRHDELSREASEWRDLERLQQRRDREGDAGAPGGLGPAPGGWGRGSGGVLVDPTARGRPSASGRGWQGRRRGHFVGGAWGPEVRLSAAEEDVLADPELDRMTPGRVFVGPGTGAAWSFVDSWYTIGPFPEGKGRHAPEVQVDLDGRYVGIASALSSWSFQQSAQPEIVPSTMRPYSVHYAFTKLRSDRAREVWLALGADDAMKVWLNGELVWDCGVHWRAWAPDEGARRVTLREGYNTLLLRLDNWPDHGAFSVAVRH